MKVHGIFALIRNWCPGGKACRYTVSHMCGGRDDYADAYVVTLIMLWWFDL